MHIQLYHYDPKDQLEHREDLELLVKNPNSYGVSRVKSFFTGRFALYQMLQKEHRVSFKDMDLKNYHELTNFPENIFSLSHTKDWGLAAMCSKDEAECIGIDLEFKERTLSPGAEKFFVNDLDSKEMSLLELWCLKEAAFKSLPLQKKPLLLKDISIQDGSFSCELIGLKGEVNIIPHPDFTIASAKVAPLKQALCL